MITAQSEAFKAWYPEIFSNLSNDTRISILRYAILAANTHNIQPWKIKLINNDSIYLYIDSSRLLRNTDPDLRHIFLSQGTFIETFIIAATHFGYECNITYLPLGIPTIDNPASCPIALITLGKSNKVSEDKLFKYITKRSTSHAVFTNRNINETQKMELLSNNKYENNGFVVKLYDDSAMLNKINLLMIEGMKIQANTIGPHSETIKMIRFRKKHLWEKRDGFSFQDLGVTGLKLKLAERFATPAMANSSFFKANVVRSIKKMAESAKAYVYIYAPEDTRENQIISGQMFCNLHLKCTMLGLSFQPMDHIFQKYDELSECENKMCDLVRIEDKTPMAVFRVGYSNTSYHTPRRDVNDLFV